MSNKMKGNIAGKIFMETTKDEGLKITINKETVELNKKDFKVLREMLGYAAKGVRNNSPLRKYWEEL